VSESPAGPHLIVEADGGSRGNPGPAGYGALVRDPITGQVLAERGEHIGRATNNVAEYRGLIAGLEAVAEFRPSLVEVRMDSKLVVEQMAGRWKIKHADLQPLALQAQRLAQGLPKVTYTWIPREKNTAADRLANQALDGVPIGELNPSLKRRRSAPSEAGLTVNDSAGSKSGQVHRPAPLGGRLDPPTRLYLLRHGLTEHTPERRFSGRNDLGLTAEGQAQIDAAAARLAAVGSISAVLSSPLVRTRESAQIVADSLHLPVEVDDDLVEMDFGKLEGMTSIEAQSVYPGQLSAFRSSAAVPAPGGESISAVQERMTRFLSRMRAEYEGRDVAVVTHMTPIKVLLCMALDVPLSTVNRMFLGPAGLSIVEWFSVGGAIVTLVNDTTHWEAK